MAVRFAELRRQLFTPVDGPGTALVAAIGACGLIWAGTADIATVEDGPVVCPLRLVTGLPCPGCGVVRSWVEALHGQWSDALLANPFGIVALAAVVGLLATVAGAALGRRRLPQLQELLPRRLVAPVAVAWIAFGVVRLLVAAAAALVG